MAAAAVDAAATAAAPRSKPEIYTVGDGKVIVENEFLNFLVIKMETMSQDDELPPVSFNSIDVSCLLAKIERLRGDVSVMRQSVSVLANVSDELHVVTKDLNLRLSAVEQHDSGRLCPSTSSRTDRGIPDQATAGDRGADSGPRAMSLRSLSVNILHTEEVAGEAESAAEDGRSTAPALPTWSTVAKRSGRDPRLLVHLCSPSPG